MGIYKLFLLFLLRWQIQESPGILEKNLSNLKQNLNSLNKVKFIPFFKIIFKGLYGFFTCIANSLIFQSAISLGSQ